MATFTSSLLLSPPSPDFSDDACSICLEPFTFVDPATITNCKHGYHLHCIIEWSQRSKECPICWQLLSLKDPASQELLAAVEAEKSLLSRSEHSSSFTSSPSSLERLNDDHDDPCSDDSDLDEQLMQHLVTAASTDRPLHRRERHRYSGTGPSQGGVSSSSDVQPPTSETEVPFKPSFSWKKLGSARRVNTSEMFSVPDSIKSKFSATSARYKESISKRTRGLKEKLIARNASVKELSKGVKREMNVGIAGVAKMIERLDLSSKRIIPVKGKSVQQNNAIDEQQQSGVFVCHISSDSPSLVPPPNVQSE
ncbi:hypothetical protein PIB30_018383 [Stylosanthes scabra]|uniref:RING-type E3 ubiquitin transferase n=1 Tax=Stylosanthes scabra TaxID=79078 RepID=A0ABU6S866_9FABA|nr:hypothetical protein [Stylosanthes scabra]